MTSALGFDRVAAIIATLGAATLLLPACLVNVDLEIDEEMIGDSSQAIVVGDGDDGDDDDIIDVPPIVFQGPSLLGTVDGYRFSFLEPRGTGDGVAQKVDFLYRGMLWGRGDGRFRSGKDVAGLPVHMRFDTAPQVRTYRIAEVKTLADFPASERAVPWHASTQKNWVFLYRLTPENGSGESLCQPPGHVESPPEIYEYALAIPLVWDSQGAVDDLPRKFTFACLSGAAAKCDAWGYGRSRAYESKAMVQACTRMVTADYCGRGESHTWDGTRIDMADNEGVNDVGHWNSWRGLSVEGLWGKDGLYCLDNHRLHAKVHFVSSGGIGVEPKTVQETLCGGITPYGRELAACPDKALQRASLSPADLDGLAPDLGFDAATDVVIANSTESDYVWLATSSVMEPPQRWVWRPQLPGTTLPTNPPGSNDPSPSDPAPSEPEPSLPPSLPSPPGGGHHLP